MKCSAFIATSADGFIAKLDGSVDWLHTAGNANAYMGEHADMGLTSYLASVDCMIMGRKTMETISKMNLTPEQWFYGDLKIIVLSNTIVHPPSNLKDKVEMYSGDISALLNTLTKKGFSHAYIDGGTTIQQFITNELLTEITITKAPVILGEGIPLFGETTANVKLENAKAIAFPNDFVQVKYRMGYLNDC